MVSQEKVENMIARLEDIKLTTPNWKGMKPGVISEAINIIKKLYKEVQAQRTFKESYLNNLNELLNRKEG